MALPQRDNYTDSIQRIEGLMAYAEQIGDWEELEHLKDRLRKLLERV